jgi:hypothetical protein
MVAQMTAAITKIAAMPFTGGASGAAAAGDMKGATTRAFALAGNGGLAAGGEESGVGAAAGLAGGLGKPPGAPPSPKGGGK